jgi:hypothetical protein
MALCGGAIIFVEGRARAALYGGEGPSLRAAVGGRMDEAASSLSELVVLVLSLAALGAAGYMLVEVKGDLFTLVLILSSVELLPLFLGAVSEGEEAAYIPMAFRTAFARLAALFCVAVCASLRFPGQLAAGLGTFRGEGAFGAVQLWKGLDFALILASLVLAALALFLFNLGRPSCGYLFEEKARGAIKGVYLLGAQGTQRAVTILLYIVLFLGYPWEGGMGVLLWSGAALGAAAVLTAARAWAEGRDRVTLRQWQGAGMLLAVLSLITALAAVL